MKKLLSVLMGCAMIAALTVIMAVSVSATEVDDLIVLDPSPDLETAQKTDPCVSCHEIQTPGVTTAWAMSAMNDDNECSDCHGDHHKDDTAMPTVETCAQCHEEKVAEYKEGKHAKAWDSMVAFPVSSNNADVLTGLTDGMKGCNDCHTVGIISDEAIAEADITYDTCPCDTCHTRHVFSKEQAAEPETCAQCHVGFDHPQYEMWSTNAMGVTYESLGEDVAPTCVTCHMIDGSHNVNTAWGFIGLRYPEEDEEWLGYRIKILQAIGVVDSEGNFTDRLDLVAAQDIAKLTTEDFEALYSAEKEACTRCHAPSFVIDQFESAEEVMKLADSYLAEAITIVQNLYADGIIEANEGWEYNPDLLYFYDSQNTVDGELFAMFLSYKNRAFQGAFHANADYTYWYGIVPLQESLDKIKAEDTALRAAKANQTTSYFAYGALAVGVLALVCTIVLFIRKK